MNKDGYNSHKGRLKYLVEKYSDKSKYTNGINSSDVDLLDKEEYWSSLHYCYLYQLHKAVQSSNEPKAEKLRRKVKQTLEKLEECGTQLGIAPENHTLEHITDICGLDF